MVREMIREGNGSNRPTITFCQLREDDLKVFLANEALAAAKKLTEWGEGNAG
jgi:hypothetical protein